MIAMFPQSWLAVLRIALCVALSAGMSVNAAPAAQDSGAPTGVFAQAQARGELIVGIPYLPPEPGAGAKIRSPERLDEAMARRLGQQLNLPVKLVQVDPTGRAAALASGRVDLVLADRLAAPPANALVHEQVLTAAVPGTVAVATGYRARPKAVIRSDTTLRHWRDVQGKTVCMSTAAFQAQALARQWGAEVRTYRVPSDALVAVREGDCDVGVIDDVTWQPLMEFPEWKKFSSTLAPEGAHSERVWLLAENSATQAWLDSAMQQWRRAKVVPAMIDQWARDVAFDVYLDQEVPDCHGG
ncbi:PhnD/SsuA/transferrin family substrate-binding protein [Bordetella sp. 02P26C-1]|uniref:PhnD/SsuA/transferrin family substrate-binding protein n=1 Tax=Bordetella sp. 02P26C-1 TaxID=2683195 RepID=UPI003FA49DE9